MKRILVVAFSVAMFGACGDSAPMQSCAPCVVEMDSTWSEVAPGVYEHDAVGQVPVLTVGSVCLARMNGAALAGSWLVEDPGSWVQDYPGHQDPQTYTVETYARIGRVSTPVCK